MSGRPGPAPGITWYPWLVEVGVVLWVSLGASGVRALLAFIDRLTVGVPLSDQTAAIVVSPAPDRPLLDLAYQLAGIALALGPVALVWYLLRSSDNGFKSIGFDASRPRRDSMIGVALALLVGTVGLGFYLIAYRLGISVQIAAVTAAHFWWSAPVILANALQNAVVEEVVVLGFVLHRAAQAAVPAGAAVAGAALIRGSYHLYQGLGGFLGNAAMGLLFGWLFLRWRRTTPFVITHFLIDAVAFLGYLWLHPRVGWLP